MKKNSKKKVINKKKKKDKLELFSWFKNHYLITISGFVGILLCVGFILFIVNIIKLSSLNKTVLTIDDMEYTKSDFNIYFYSVKYDYFGQKVDTINSDDLKVVVDSDNNITLGEYLKKQTLNEIKSATAIKEYASKNNVELNDNDYQELKKDKQKYIKSIGGKSKFKKLLKDNKTLEKSYDSMAETDKLYRKLVNKLYGEGRRKDLTEEELSKASEDYKQTYFKIEQVILPTIDIETRKSLSDTEINQKKTLAQTISEMASSGEDFDSLIKKYSEGAVDKEPPYFEYYKSGQLLQPIEEAVVKLENNQTSEVIQTDYAFHIIKKLELDDSKYNEYLDELREEKALKDLNATLDSLKVIYRDAYKKIKY